ncbi:MgtC/SapB family protein [Spirochaeta africana]|uniref:Protein MgtC n=1 Tax=Spirochaeta africana (strain ATCC 700263 / DSM 8902 / Z-7692) TaxID=889378 RepID=H9UG84_SPIAZ|nr:MgtC/SapB family protein [Spirochaeta africana]AFG36527.1 putative membrane protein [Spirochaeta africana DSM 8902]
MMLHIFALRLAAALAFGMFIGAERQWRQRTAGIRTNALVAVGATLFVLLSVMVEGDTSPTRIPAQIVSGIGFIGAGVIFKEGFSVSGLNTAATIWATAAVGALTGFGFIPEAGIGVAMILIANTALRFSYRITHSTTEELDLDYRMVIICELHDEHHIRSVLHSMLTADAIALVGLSREEADKPDQVAVIARLRMQQGHAVKLENTIARIGVEQSVHAVHWEIAA